MADPASVGDGVAVGGRRAGADAASLGDECFMNREGMAVVETVFEGHYGAKNRHGPTTVLDLIFRGHYSQISEGPEWGRERAS